MKQENDRIKKTAIILFLIALGVRFSLLIFWDHNRIPDDATVYHRIAVNLVRGNGFSNQEEEPFEKYYFREPGYPLFLAGIYSIINIFNPVEYINTAGIHDHKLDTIYPEIVATKVVQIFLDCIGILLLFFILARISNMKISFWTALLTALFFNLACYSIFLLRETLVVFLLLILNWFYLKYLHSEKKYPWLVIMGLITGLLILIFQAHVVILPVLFVLIWIHSKSFKKSIIHGALVSVSALMVISPHLIKVYRFYPDFRIFKTLGNSFTYEMLEYDGAARMLYRLNIIREEEFYPMRDWTKPSRIHFDRSFNGYYTKKAESLRALIPAEYKTPKFRMKMRIQSYLKKFRRSFFLIGLPYITDGQLITTDKPIILIPLLGVPVLVGVFGLIGLGFYWRRYLIYLLPFVVYSMLFLKLGSESRRMLILHPFLIFFGMLLLDKILKKFGINWLKTNHIESPGT